MSRTVPSAPRAARPVREDWRRLAASGPEPPRFTAAMVTALPEPARRWLTHAIDPGTPLWTTVDLSMRGEIRIGRWHPFTAREILAPPTGYIWAARSRLGGMPVTGYDRLMAAEGEMRWRLAGLIPVMSARGADVTRSAAGRLAGEGVLLPTAFRHATWTEGSRAGTAIATWQIGAETEHAHLCVGEDGRLIEVTVDRWGNPDGAPYGRYLFRVAVDEEMTFSGVTIASAFRAGWSRDPSHHDQDEFFRARITNAAFQ